MPDTPLEEAIKRGSRVDLFVYGTLQTGQALHDWVAADIFRKCPATANGRLHPMGEYPVAFFTSDTTLIYGEVLTVDLTSAVLSCVEMELQAGYQCRWVDVTFVDGNTQKALSFEYSDPADPHIGPRIESGNWIDHAAEQSDQQAEFMATVLGEMIMKDTDLYTEIVDILLDESADDPSMTEALAISDLELMLFNKSYVDMLRDYIQQACENMKDTDE